MTAGTHSALHIDVESHQITCLRSLMSRITLLIPRIDYVLQSQPEGTYNM